MDEKEIIFKIIVIWIIISNSIFTENGNFSQGPTQTSVRSRPFITGSLVEMFRTFYDTLRVYEL